MEDSRPARQATADAAPALRAIAAEPPWGRAASAGDAHLAEVGTKFQHVLAAIDGSPASFRAAALGAQIATASGGSIELLSVVQRADLTGRLGFGAEGEDAQRLRAEADVRSAAAAIAPAPIRAMTVAEGPIVETILERCACGDDERLICMGSGRHRFRLGSVSGEVLRRAECPVLVVREGTSRGPRVERILVGFDATPGAWAAVDAAAELSRDCDAAVYLVEVLRPGFPLPPQGLPLAVGEMQELAGAPERREIHDAAERIEAAGGRVAQALFELGKPPERLLAQAEAADVDLIVVGARGEHSPGMRRLLGGTSDHLVARSQRPVLVLK